MRWFSDILGTRRKVKGRRGDGTVLGDLITKGTYRAEAGMEKVGYFDPTTAPFRTFLAGKTGLLQHPKADQVIEKLTGPVWDSFPGRVRLGEDTAVDLAVALRLRSTKQVLESFMELANRKFVLSFLLVTTTMPFFEKYSIGKIVVITEIDLELRLNALANILLNDPDFSDVHSIEAFKSKASLLLKQRKAEVEKGTSIPPSS